MASCVPSAEDPQLMGMAAPLYYTADMVRAIPDDSNRYEVVYGELLVTPAPTAWHEVRANRRVKPSVTVGIDDRPKSAAP